MRRFILTLPLLVSACTTATPGSLEALADASRQARAEHAAALAETTDDRVAITGANLIEILDAGFARVGAQ
jgi:hypothetical protein